MAWIPGGAVAPPYGQNAYGPLHNILAPLILVHPLAPKLLITGGFMAAAGYLLSAKPIRLTGLAFFAAILLASSLTYYFGIAAGCNDLLVAGFVLCAFRARHDGRLYELGIWIGLGMLLKFYPAVFLPFLLFGTGRSAWRALAAAAVTFGLGMLAAFAIWGPAILSPIVFAASRHAAWFSLPALASQLLGPIVGDDLMQKILSLNVVLVALVGGATLWALHRARMNWVWASVLGPLVILLSYKLGHPQFYLPSLASIAAAAFLDPTPFRRLRWLLPFLVLLWVFCWAFGHMHSMPIFDPVSRFTPLLASVFGFGALFAILWQDREARVVAPA